MRIAVDTRFWQSDEKPEFRNFTKEVFGKLAVQHAEHQFIFVTDTALIVNNDLPVNVTTVTITPKPVNFLSYKWWYDVKLPLALKKCKADLFIGSYGICSLTTPVRQIVIIRDISFLQKQLNSSDKPKSYYKRYTKSFIRKAEAVVTLSDFVQDELVNQYKITKNKIKTIGSGANAAFKPVEWEERETIKAEYAEGSEYFVCTNGANFLNVLKAFSIFKKWQKTNMKLLVIGRFEAGFEKDLEKLKSYKYREDVFIKKNLAEIERAAVVAASYAVIFPSFYEGFAVPVLEALNCEVAVITSANSSMSEIAGEAALYADPVKPEDIAEQMKKIFKDEQLRNKLIEAGKQRSALYSWDKTTSLLWQVIEQVVSK